LQAIAFRAELTLRNLGPISELVALVFLHNQELYLLNVGQGV